MAVLEDTATVIPTLPARVASPRRRLLLRRLRWVGVVPFFAYLAVFLVIPTGEMVVDAFKGPSGSFTMANVSAIVHGQYLAAYEVSLEVSALSTLIGGVLGFLIAAAIVRRGVPPMVRSVTTVLSGAASNFAGVPLAVAFTWTIGTTGLVTGWLKPLFNLSQVLPLSSVWGLTVVYVYFQFPLMVILSMPMLMGLRDEWREAAAGLGAGRVRYWASVAMPILLPSLLGSMVLLFGSAFSAYATAYALSGSTGTLVTEYIGNLINGNITVDPQLAYSLAFGMLVIMVVSVALSVTLQRRTTRWLR